MAEATDPADGVPSLIFQGAPGMLPGPTEGSITFARDMGLREGQTLRLTGLDVDKRFRITEVVPPAEDADPVWTVAVVEW